MNAFVYTLTALSTFLGQFGPDPACKGPNCRYDQPSGYESLSPQFGPAFGTRRYSPADRSTSIASCGCSTCDPNIPCSTGHCQDQGCADCGRTSANVRSKRAPRRSPVTQPAGDDVTFRSLPRPQAHVQKMCPVTGEELGSMGPPVAVNSMGKRIYVCCESCVTAVRRNPEKYLQKVIDELAPVPQPSFPANRPRED